ncbi:hypothetical protein HMN09_00865000 [Mycena chlorophos]|uniref:F-box domain-containing protein n=1 Tax=Mycena chlorophos TaxID=658473 RepID=A0A8H6SMW3_MYCCL|nr:hypothetical protein HMN09_00865000 [Mycena chlorophos]
MAASIPPELIEAIVEHIPNVASLKSCSLVSPTFRVPCQKRLHPSLHLEFVGPDSQRYRRTSEAVSRRFEESPHLAAFITHLILEIVSPWNGPDDQSAFARHVFARLGHVKKTSIFGGRLGGAMWSSLPPDLDSAVLEWLAHRGSTEPLQELVLANICLPEAAVPVIFSSAASLVLHNCTLEHMPASQQQATVKSAPQVRAQARALRRFEAHSSWRVVELLCRQEHHWHVSALRSLALRLGIMNDNTSLGMFADLCASSADTLTSLKLWIPIIDPRQRELLLQRFTAALPHVRAVSVILEALRSPDELDSSLWVLRRVMSPALLPCLTQITYIVYLRLETRILPMNTNLHSTARAFETFKADWLTSYDEFVTDHPSLTSFVWEAKFYALTLGDVRDDDARRHEFERFCGETQRVMPKAHGKGLLVFRLGD